MIFIFFFKFFKFVVMTDLTTLDIDKLKKIIINEFITTCKTLKSIERWQYQRSLIDILKKRLKSMKKRIFQFWTYIRDDEVWKIEYVKIEKLKFNHSAMIATMRAKKISRDRAKKNRSFFLAVWESKTKTLIQNKSHHYLRKIKKIIKIYSMKRALNLIKIIVAKKLRTSRKNVSKFVDFMSNDWAKIAIESMILSALRFSFSFSSLSKEFLLFDDDVLLFFSFFFTQSLTFVEYQKIAFLTTFLQKIVDSFSSFDFFVMFSKDLSMKLSKNSRVRVIFTSIHFFRTINFIRFFKSVDKRKKRQRQKKNLFSFLKRQKRKTKINKSKNKTIKEVICSCKKINQDWLLKFEQKIEYMNDLKKLELLARLMYDDFMSEICFTHFIVLIKKFDLLSKVENDDNWDLLKKIWFHRNAL